MPVLEEKKGRGERGDEIRNISRAFDSEKGGKKGSSLRSERLPF